MPSSQQHASHTPFEDSCQLKTSCTRPSTPQLRNRLIHGSLIQLGQVLITRPVRNKLPDVAPIDTCTIKLAVYQDQWPGQWSTFGDGPTKQVMLSFPVMTLCRSAGCGDTCPKFHPPVDEDHITNVILDIWGRQWVSAQGA